MTPEDAYRLTSVEDFYSLPSDRLKWTFIQGQLERRGNVNVYTCRVELVSSSNDFLREIASFAQIPHHFEDVADLFSLVYYDMNAIDFLGHVYHRERIIGHSFYDKFIFLLTGQTHLDSCLVYRTCPEAVLPSQSRVTDAGHDLTIIKKVKNMTPKVSLYDTGLRVRVPHGYYTEIVPRSSLSKSGYMLANSIGVIDRGYHGNLLIALAKIDDEVPPLSLPFRCCQIIFRKQEFLRIEEIDIDLEETSRGAGGFGSTG